MKLGGSISAEHGVGVARAGELPRYKDAQALDLMRAVKRAIDPQRIMNPRALIP
ncbi:MAG TPA: FAD-linked oxidase C-terminal domain-containing protein [Terricaulis sp.]|nr:FAD-linked oxidase C-terminal domain-containing protein [Terricaulis sp.]